MRDVPGACVKRLPASFSGPDNDLIIINDDCDQVLGTMLDLPSLLVAFGFLLALVWLIAYPLLVPPKNRRKRSVTACYLIAMLCNHSTYVTAEMFGHDARGARGGNATTVSAGRHDPSSSWLAGATIGGEAARVNVGGHLAKAKSQKADIASPSTRTAAVPGVMPHRSAPFLAVS